MGNALRKLGEGERRGTGRYLESIRNMFGHNDTGDASIDNPKRSIRSVDGLEMGKGVVGREEMGKGVVRREEMVKGVVGREEMVKGVVGREEMVKGVVRREEMVKGVVGGGTERMNYILRAVKDMTAYEKTLLSIALLFLAINAYTNLSYPKIMGQCVEAEDGEYTKSNLLITLLQKTNFLKKFLFKSDNNKTVSTIFNFLPYFVCGGLASYFRIYFTNKCITRVEYRLKRQVHYKIITQNDEKFNKTKSADYLVNCTFNEIKLSSKELITCITQILRYINSIIGGIISMVFISSYLTKLCIIIVPAYGFFALFILRRLRNIKMDVAHFEEKQMARFSDILKKKNIISLFANENYENKYFSDELKFTKKLNDKYVHCESLFYSFLNIGTNLVICSILCFGKIELSKNNITHGQLVSFIAYSSMLGLGLIGMIKLKKDLSILHLSLRKIYEIIDVPPVGTHTCGSSEALSKYNSSNDPHEENCPPMADIIQRNYSLVLEPHKKIGNINDGSSNGCINNVCNTDNSSSSSSSTTTNESSTNSGRVEGNVCTPRKSLPADENNKFPREVRGSIRFENVHFSYNSYDENRKKKVLTNINFEINKNEKVAIVGKSGSGKSTLWKLLTKEYEYEGNIYVDNYNIKDIDKTFFKKNIVSINEQECCVLNRSLYENLTYALIPVQREEEKSGKKKKKISYSCGRGSSSSGIGNNWERKDSSRTPKIIFDSMDFENLIRKKICFQAIMLGNQTSDNASSNLTHKNEHISYKIYHNNSKRFSNNIIEGKDNISPSLNSSEEEYISFIRGEKELIIRENVKDGVEDDDTTDTTNSNSCMNKTILTDKVSTELYRNNYELLNHYGHKLDIINATVNVLCEELNLNNFIRSMPEHIHTIIQNDSISSGQKQRLSIIRSLMKDTPIYIFDEITSFLDEANIDKLFSLINMLLPNKTIIYITHSAKILHQMDKVIIVDDGEISSVGTYDQVKNHPLFMNIFSVAQ
ncbi:ABC transporter B family member 5, putative [Plasmodium malariae]|uniref:ABC transporter B family member 5, putative n=1 Tax=Plasmodium malariae TaxID=5858 RepID=A0A1D3SP16_PLAMA|nr:ABC transporter B family member 5, putative [Plasmodium malariae]SCO93659.1 ABC transporter B family member 5, putative [Plasmodium malariae]